MVNGLSNQQPQVGGILGHHHMKIQEIFSDLSKSIGGDGTEISKDQLQKALQDAQSQGNTQKATMLSKMVDNFAQLSGGSDNITADSLKKAIKAMKNGNSQSSQAVTSKGNCTPCTNCGSCGKTQDPSSVTPEQLKSPIDIRV